MFTTTRAGRAWHFTAAVANDSVMIGVRYPGSVAVADDGAIFVLSRGMPVDGESAAGQGCKIGKWTLEGARLGDFARNEFTWPAGIAIAADDTIYCSDEHDNFVAAYSPDGPFYPFPDFNPDGEHLSKWGETGSAPGRLNGPSGIAFDPQDELYVADARNNRVQKFTKDGGYLTGWGSRGNGPGQFDRPWGMTVDRDGYVYVADWGNDRVQKLSPEGDFVMSFGSDPDSGGDLNHPSGVAVDSDGDVYVTDWGNKRVQIYEPDGEIIGALYGNAIDPYKGLVEDLFQLTDNSRKADARIEHGPLLGRFDRPVGIAVDRHDRVYVADSRRCRVQVYSKDTGYIDAPAEA